MIKHASELSKIAEYTGSVPAGTVPAALSPVSLHNMAISKIRDMRTERNRVLPVDFKDFTNGDYDKAALDLFNSFSPAERRQFRVAADPSNPYDSNIGKRRSSLGRMFGSAWLTGSVDGKSVPMCNAVVANILQRTHGVPIMTNKETGRIYTVSDINKLIASGKPVLNGYALDEVPYDQVNNESGLLVIDPTHMGITTNMGGEFGTINASYGTGLVKGYWGNRNHRSTKASTARNKVAPKFYRFRKLQQQAAKPSNKVPMTVDSRSAQQQ